MTPNIDNHENAQQNERSRKLTQNKSLKSYFLNTKQTVMCVMNKNIIIVLNGIVRITKCPNPKYNKYEEDRQVRTTRAMHYDSNLFAATESVIRSALSSFRKCDLGRLIMFRFLSYEPSNVKL